jgi:hypothetical protein
LLIGIVVALFSRPGLGDLDLRVSHLQSSVDELKKSSEAQATEIRELRKVIEGQRQSAAGKEK